MQDLSHLSLSHARTRESPSRYQAIDRNGIVNEKWTLLEKARPKLDLFADRSSVIRLELFSSPSLFHGVITSTLGKQIEATVARPLVFPSIVRITL